MSGVFGLVRGRSALVVSLPHVGTALPEGLGARLTAAGRALVDTDWHVDKLFAGAARAGATVLTARYGRYVVDLNRGVAGETLYPGMAETGVVPSETFDGAPLYAGALPDAAEREARVAQYWAPYHAALADELARVRAEFGFALLLDGHSIRSRIPRLFEGVLPGLNVGTNGGGSASPAVVRAVMAVVEGAGFSWVLDGRFRGGFITRHYGRPADGVHAVQLEIAQACYMAEGYVTASGEPVGCPPAWDAARAAPLVAVIEALVGRLQATRRP